MTKSSFEYGHIDLKKFKPSTGEWCWWYKSDTNEEHKRWIKQQEVAEFREEYDCKMKAIKPQDIWHMGGSNILSGIMKIVETAAPEGEEKLLLTQPIQIDCKEIRLMDVYELQTIAFSKPIFMKPNKKYEIRFDFDDSWSEKKFYMMKTGWQSTEIVPLFCLNFEHCFVILFSFVFF